MADAAVSLSVAGKKAVHLEPDIIYRIGKRPELEFYIADESMELAHATISLLRSGAVRLAAAIGKVWVNEQEQSLVDLSARDVSDGYVKLRFGNVEAKLEIVEANRDKDEAPNATVDSLVIPETEIASVNTTTDSLFIPETQAMPLLARPSAGSKRSLGDDLMIPETQDDLAHQFQPVANEADRQVADDEEDCSEMGTQLRICTQDFNDFDADAIDDFDSSLILGDFPGELLPAKPPVAEQEIAKNEDVSELEMSKLNWSAVNSTKIDPVRLQGTETARSTPDLFDSAVAGEDRADTCTPDLFDLLPAPVKSASPTQQLGGTKQLVVATIEGNQDYIETQVFPMRGDRATKEIEAMNQDYIETQAFPLKKGAENSPNLTKPSENDQVNQDNIETQQFTVPMEKSSKNKSNKDDSIVPTSFVGSSSMCQDLIETQPFPVLQKGTTIASNKENLHMNVSHAKSPTADWVNQDLIETQRFVPPARKVSVPLAVQDEIDHVLDEMITSGPLSSSSDEADEEPIKFIEPCVIMDKYHNQKVCQIEGVFAKSQKKGQWKQKLATDRIVRSVTPGEDSCSSTESPKGMLQLPGTSFQTSINSLKLPAISKDGSIEPTKKRSVEKPNEGDIRRDLRSRRSQSVPENLEKVKAKSKAKSTANVAPNEENKSKERKPKVMVKKLKDIDSDGKNKIASQNKEELKIDKVEKATAPTKRTTKSRCPPKKPTDEVDIGSSTLLQKSTGSLKRAASSRAGSTEPPIKQSPQKLAEVSEADLPERQLRSRGRPRKGQSTTVVPEEAQLKPKAESSKKSTKAIQKEAKLEPKEDSTIKTSANEGSAQENNSKKRKAVSKHNEVKSKQKSSSQKENESTTDKVERGDKKVKREEPTKTSETGTKAPKDAATSKSVSKSLPKRHSGGPADPLQSINQYVKSKKALGKIKIALSMCNMVALEGVLKALRNAIEVTANPQECHVLIMDKGERTFKFLTAIAGNKPVLSTQWLYSLRESRSIVISPNHLFNDTKFESLFKFNPLMVMEKPKILENINFMLSDGIQPNESEMKTIIESAGGRIHSRRPPVIQDNPLYVVTTIKLASRHRQLLRNYDNVKYIKTEGVMQSLLQHNLELLNEFQLKF